MDGLMQGLLFLPSRRSQACKRQLAIDVGGENESQVRLLELLQELNNNRIYPSFHDLLEQFCNSKSFVELHISELARKGHIEQILLSDDSGEYSWTAYKITEKGRYAIGRYVSKVSYFVQTLNGICESGTNEQLYKLLEDSRDLLWFAHYRGTITKAQIENMAKQLEISPERVWWGDRQGQIGGDASIAPQFSS
jgi:hypothetical protein